MTVGQSNTLEWSSATLDRHHPTGHPGIVEPRHERRLTEPPVVGSTAYAAFGGVGHGGGAAVWAVGNGAMV